MLRGHFLRSVLPLTVKVSVIVAKNWYCGQSHEWFHPPSVPKLYYCSQILHKPSLSGQSLNYIMQIIFQY